jgi:DNA modification methylase
MLASPVLMLGDCLERMGEIADGSVDMVLCDLPYGTTACKWDSVIPFEPLWAQYRRVAKPSAAIVLFAAQPFTTVLIASNIREFRYCWMWDKKVCSGFAFAKYQPMRAHEDICVFGKPGGTYNPQMVERTEQELKRLSRGNPKETKSDFYRGFSLSGPTRDGNRFRHPSTVIRINGVAGRSGEKVAHPTQKPVALLEYLIKTYTNEGETVLDNTMGSGSTGVAALKCGRQFIGIERDPEYFAIAQRRISEAANAGPLFEAAE